MVDVSTLSEGEVRDAWDRFTPPAGVDPPYPVEAYRNSQGLLCFRIDPGTAGEPPAPIAWRTTT